MKSALAHSVDMRVADIMKDAVVNTPWHDHTSHSSVKQGKTKLDNVKMTYSHCFASCYNNGHDINVKE